MFNLTNIHRNPNKKRHSIFREMIIARVKDEMLPGNINLCVLRR